MAALTLWGMVYTDDAGIVYQSSAGLEGVMAVIVTGCASFGFRVSEAKTEITCLQPGGGQGVIRRHCSRSGVQTTGRFVYLGGAISANRDLIFEVTHRLQR